MQRSGARRRHKRTRLHRALRLLEAHGAAAFELAGPCGFTALHAAALGGCAAAMPALVAAGVAVDGQLQMPVPSWQSWPTLRSFLQAMGLSPPRLHICAHGRTALALAVK